MPRSVVWGSFSALEVWMATWIARLFEKRLGLWNKFQDSVQVFVCTLESTARRLVDLKILTDNGRLADVYMGCRLSQTQVVSSVALILCYLISQYASLLALRFWFDASACSAALLPFCSTIWSTMLTERLTVELTDATIRVLACTCNLQQTFVRRIESCLSLVTGKTIHAKDLRACETISPSL